MFIRFCINVFREMKAHDEFYFDKIVNMANINVVPAQI